MKIEVTEETRDVRWTDKKTGERRSMVVQTAWAHVPGDKYPSKIEVTPPRDSPPYAAGLYVMAPESVVVVDGKLAIRLKLLTQSQAAARVPSAGKAA